MCDSLGSVYQRKVTISNKARQHHHHETMIPSGAEKVESAVAMHETAPWKRNVVSYGTYQLEPFPTSLMPVVS